MSQINPITIDSKEAINTANLDVSPSNLFSKASVEIKMDIVKPIPAKKPTPKNRFNVTFFGKLIIFVFTNKKVADIMPSGLPIKRPKMMAIESGDAKLAKEAPEIYKLVFAKAKTGMIIKLTGKLRIDSYRVILFIGSNIAIIMPANVA